MGQYVDEVSIFVQLPAASRLNSNTNQRVKVCRYERLVLCKPPCCTIYSGAGLLGSAHSRLTMASLCPHNIPTNHVCTNCEDHTSGQQGSFNPDTGYNEFPDDLLVPDIFRFGNHPQVLGQPLLSGQNYPIASTSYNNQGISPLQTIAPTQNTIPIVFSHNIVSLVDTLYPSGVSAYLSHRSALVQLLESSWIQHGTLEPSDATKQFITITGRKYRCSVPSCGKHFTRLDRAINHFRTHIHHRPYTCEGCEVPNCPERFYTQETLRAHVNRKRTVCKYCETTLELKNLRRHLRFNRTCKTKRNMRRHGPGP